MSRMVRRFGSLWGVFGIVALLLWAITRLWPHALVVLQTGLSVWQWLVLAAWVIWMIYSEGYVGFQRRIAPRIIQRARYIARAGNSIEVVLAPLYCFGYFRASRRELIVSYTALIAIIAAVLIVHELAQPWRGIIDCGVVAGLGYGIGAIMWRSISEHRSSVA